MRQAGPGRRPPDGRRAMSVAWIVPAPIVPAAVDGEGAWRLEPTPVAARAFARMVDELRSPGIWGALWQREPGTAGRLVALFRTRPRFPGLAEAALSGQRLPAQLEHDAAIARAFARHDSLHPRSIGSVLPVERFSCPIHEFAKKRRHPVSPIAPVGLGLRRGNPPPVWPILLPVRTGRSGPPRSSRRVRSQRL